MAELPTSINPLHTQHRYLELTREVGGANHLTNAIIHVIVLLLISMSTVSCVCRVGKVLLVVIFYGACAQMS